MKSELVKYFTNEHYQAVEGPLKAQLNLDIFHSNGFSRTFLFVIRVRKDTHFIFFKESIMHQKLETTDHFCNWLHYF